MPTWNQMNELNAGLLLFSVCVTLFLLPGAAADCRRGGTFMKSFFGLLISNLVMQLGEAGIWLFEGISENIPLLTVCCVLSFGTGGVMAAMFAYTLIGFVRERKNVSWLPAHIIAAAGFVFFLDVIVSAFQGSFFAFDARGMFVDGPQSVFITLFDLAAFLVETGMVLCYRKLLSTREILSLLAFGILPFMMILFQKIWYPTPEYLAVTLSLMLLCTMFHGEAEKQQIEKEKKLAESRISIMSSRLNSHFLYNSLASIYQLCDTEPLKAQQAIGYFGKYLRRNLESIEVCTLVPFEEELRYVENYLYLEKMRYGDKLEVVYHIEAEQFLIPVMTVQLLVENAVRYGIGKKKKGGRVTITAWENLEAYKITVSDNGTGYDILQLPPDKKRIRSCLKNVGECLDSMCGGRLEISSVPGEGTTASMTIPKGERIT